MKTKKQKSSKKLNNETFFCEYKPFGDTFTYTTIPVTWTESFREKLIEDLLLSIDELNSIFWEEDTPRKNPVSYEIAEVVTLARIIKKMQTGEKNR